MADADLTAHIVRRLLTYLPDTGQFLWRVGRNRGRQAGTVNGTYRYIRIAGKNYLAHRLAWLYVHGDWPEHQVDHRNGVRLDNRIANLRRATPKQNMENRSTQKNNTSGYPGVVWFKGRWRARVKHHGKYISLGMYDDPELAGLVCDEARSRYFTHLRAPA